MREVKRRCGAKVLDLFENAFASRVNLRLLIRIVRFWRSTRLVEMSA
jgi:hypothetical protein